MQHTAWRHSGLDCSLNIGNIKLPKLGAVMTAWAKSDKVGKVIRLFVVLILAIDKAKLTEWSNVVDIRLFAQLFAGDPAYLASVIVALACLMALLVPVWAIVAGPSTFPLVGGFAYHVLRLPLASAIKIAEKIIASNEVIGLASHLRTAIGAVNINAAARPHGMSFADFVLRLPLAPTDLVAKMVSVAFNASARPHECLSARVAVNRLLRKKGVICSTLILGSPLLNTWGAAKYMLPLLRRLRALKNNTALLTGKLHFSIDMLPVAIKVAKVPLLASNQVGNLFKLNTAADASDRNLFVNGVKVFALAPKTVAGVITKLILVCLDLIRRTLKLCAAVSTWYGDKCFAHKNLFTKNSKAHPLEKSAKGCASHLRELPMRSTRKQSYLPLPALGQA